MPCRGGLKEILGKLKISLGLERSINEYKKKESYSKTESVEDNPLDVKSTTTEKNINGAFNCVCYKCNHSWQYDSQKLQTDGGAKCPSCG